MNECGKLRFGLDLGYRKVEQHGLRAHLIKDLPPAWDGFTLDLQDRGFDRVADPEGLASLFEDRQGGARGGSDLTERGRHAAQNHDLLTFNRQPVGERPDRGARPWSHGAESVRS